MLSLHIDRVSVYSAPAVKTDELIIEEIDGNFKRVLLEFAGKNWKVV